MDRTARSAERPSGSKKNTGMRSGMQEGKQTEMRSGMRDRKRMETRSGMRDRKQTETRSGMSGRKRAEMRSGALGKKRGKGRRTKAVIPVAALFQGGQNRLSMFLAATVAIILTVAVSFNGIALYRRLAANRVRIEELTQELESEERRAAQIEEYNRYTQTDAYIEEIAREKLGLVYEGEIVFRQE